MCVVHVHALDFILLCGMYMYDALVHNVITRHHSLPAVFATMQMKVQATQLAQGHQKPSAAAS